MPANSSTRPRPSCCLPCTHGWTGAGVSFGCSGHGLGSDNASSPSYAAQSKDQQGPRAWGASAATSATSAGLHRYFAYSGRGICRQRRDRIRGCPSIGIRRTKLSISRYSLCQQGHAPPALGLPTPARSRTWGHLRQQQQRTRRQLRGEARGNFQRIPWTFKHIPVGRQHADPRHRLTAAIGLDQNRRRTAGDHAHRVVLT